MKQANTTVIASQSAAGSLTSAAIDARNLYSVSAQAVTTGTIIGTMKLQASNDVPVNATAPTNWSDIPSATVSITTGGGAFLVPKTDVCYEYIRVVYTFTSGVGLIAVNLKSLSV